MVTATKSRPRQQVQRTMQFVKTGMVNLLWITQGRRTDGYMSDYIVPEPLQDRPRTIASVAACTLRSASMANPGGANRPSRGR